MDRLERQVAFLLAADKLKSVRRTNRLRDGSRHENPAEHSWHLALMALVLAEHAPPGADLARVLALVVAHDLVEVYAGDTWAFADEAPAAQAEREAVAAARLFGLLPGEQHAHFLELWREFEARQTVEARFAWALDALHPVLLTWPDSAGPPYERLTARRVLERKRGALEAFPDLWALTQRVLDEAVRKGALEP